MYIQYTQLIQLFYYFFYVEKGLTKGNKNSIKNIAHWGASP